MKESATKGLDVHRSAKRVEPEVTGKCPLCGQVTLQETRPFCSIRCANIDLNRWLSEGYAVTNPED